MLLEITAKISEPSHGRSWHDFAYPWAQRGKRRGPRTSGPSWASSWAPSLCGASCACLCGPLWAWRLNNKETNITLCDNTFLDNFSKVIDENSTQSRN